MRSIREWACSDSRACTVHGRITRPTANFEWGIIIAFLLVF